MMFIPYPLEKVAAVGSVDVLFLHSGPTCARCLATYTVTYTLVLQKVPSEGS